MTIDLTGTSPQIDDRPINMPFVGTVDIAIFVTLRSVLLDTALMEYVPQNSGLVRPIHIVAPKGCLANPIYPAPVIARCCPGNIVADTLMKALAQVAPHNISGGIGNIKVASYSGALGEDYWVYMDITEGSYGGRYGKDGMDGVDTLYANTRNNPIEDIEAHLPLRVTRYELIEDASGAGKWRGGLGSIRDIQFCSPGQMSLEGEGNKYAPWGIFGGQDGTPGGVEILNPDTDEIQILPSKFPCRKTKSGDTLRTISPCGGGYGAPLERELTQVLEDVIDEFMTVESAKRDYGVVIDPVRLVIDEQATASLRQQMISQ